MIINFIHKGLEEFHKTGNKAGILPDHEKRLRLILGRLNVAREPSDMKLPGLGLHKLKGNYKNFLSVQVSGNWRVIFKFKSNDVIDVGYLDYH